MVFSFLFLVLALVSFAAVVMELMSYRSLTSGAELYDAEFVGFEERKLGRKKRYYYICHIPELDIDVTTVEPAFFGQRKAPREGFQVYYNENIPEFCYIKGAEDMHMTISSRLLTTVIFTALAFVVYAKL